MRIGAVFPQLEIGNDPADVRAWARGVEELGFRHVLVYDHVLGAGTAGRPGWRGYTEQDAFHEVFVLFGYLAAVTRDVELVTGVLVLPQRQTALVAKQAAEVDVLSGGRLRLGVGVGWNAVEFEALGTDFAGRGARVEEQIAVLRALWAEPTVTFDGTWHRVPDAGINPLPPRRGIPIWIGGTAEVALRRTARLADGWFPQGPPDDTYAAAVERLRGYVRDAGREPGEIGIEPRLTLSEVPRERWTDFASSWRDLGATHLCVNTMGSGLRDVGEHLAALRDVLAAVGPQD
jgi:probable F420-dependent oxidoreductase